MFANLKLKSGQKGAKKLGEQPGDKFVYDSYRCATVRPIHYKTAELIVAEAP